MTLVIELSQHLGGGCSRVRLYPGRGTALFCSTGWRTLQCSLWWLISQGSDRTTLGWTAQYIIVTFVLARRSASDSHPSCVVICVTLHVLWKYWLTNLAERRWVFLRQLMFFWGGRVPNSAGVLHDMSNECGVTLGPSFIWASSHVSLEEWWWWLMFYGHFCPHYIG